MIVFLYIIFAVLAGLLISLFMPGFTDDLNFTLYLFVTGTFAISALIIMLRKFVSFFRTLSVYIAVFLSLFIVAEGTLIYFSGDAVPTGNEQAIIVTGSGLFVESRLTAELEERLDKAIEIYTENPTLPIVLSGGTDENRTLPQCVAMQAYLENQISDLGLETPMILAEDKSSGLYQNISMSLEKSGIEQAYIIVSRHNVTQTKLIADKLSPGSTVVGAEYPISKYIIYFIRELWFVLQTIAAIGL